MIFFKIQVNSPSTVITVFRQNIWCETCMVLNRVQRISREVI